MKKKENKTKHRKDEQEENIDVHVLKKGHLRHPVSDSSLPYFWK